MFSATMSMLAVALAWQGPTPTAIPSTTTLVREVLPTQSGSTVPAGMKLVDDDDYERRFLGSDLAFEKFVSPITSPTHAKDPRSLSQIRFMFINNWIPGNHLILADGTARAYGMQVNVALTERLAIIADKSGYATLEAGGASTDGWLNTGIGMKYVLIRDPDAQFLLTAGFHYEIPSGEAAVFQGFGNGVIQPFLTMGKEWNCKTHFIGNLGYSAPFSRRNSGFLNSQLHFDHNLFGNFYPLIELNWYHYMQGGNNLVGGIGEGDSLLNLGTTGVAGNDLVTIAFGNKINLHQNVEIGVAWEFPISNRKDLLENRLTADLILRW